MNLLLYPAILAGLLFSPPVPEPAQPIAPPSDEVSVFSSSEYQLPPYQLSFKKSDVLASPVWSPISQEKPAGKTLEELIGICRKDLEERYSQKGQLCEPSAILVRPVTLETSPGNGEMKSQYLLFECGVYMGEDRLVTVSAACLMNGILARASSH